MSLGLILGGIAKGYQEGEDLKNERAKRDALELDTKIKRAADDRQTLAEGLQAGIPTVGVTQVPQNYDPTQDSPAMVQGAAPPQAPSQQKTGILSALGRFLKPEAAATAAGVTPPPVTPVTPPAPPPAGAAAPGTPEDGVTVTANTSMRPATERDVALYRWIAAKRSGTPAEELAAGKEYVDASQREVDKAIMGSTPDQLAMLLTETTGKQTDVTPNKAGGFDVSIDGKQIMSAKSADELRAEARQLTSNDPMAALKVTQSVRAEDLANLTARSEINLRAAQAQAALTNAGAAATTAKVAAHREGRESTITDLNLQDRARLQQAWSIIRDPDAALKDPVAAGQAAQTIHELDPHDSTFQTVIDQRTQAITRNPISAAQYANEAAQRAFATNPYVTGDGLQDGKPAVAPVKMSDGSTQFAVRDPKTNAIAGTFASSAAALSAARRLYGMPKAKKK